MYGHFNLYIYIYIYIISKCSRIKNKNKNKKKIKKPKPKPTPNQRKRTMQTRRNFIQAKKKGERQKVEKDKRLVVGWRRAIFSNIYLPHFLSHFLPILERLNFGGFREKTAGLHHFSLPLPFSTKHPSHSFSLLFSTIFFHLP